METRLLQSAGAGAWPAALPGLPKGGVAQRRAGVGAGRARDHRVWGGRDFGGVDVRRATAVGLGRARGSNAGAGVAHRRATSVISSFGDLVDTPPRCPMMRPPQTVIHPARRAAPESPAPRWRTWRFRPERDSLRAGVRVPPAHRADRRWPGTTKEERHEHVDAARHSCTGASRPGLESLFTAVGPCGQTRPRRSPPARHPSIRRRSRSTSSRWSSRRRCPRRRGSADRPGSPRRSTTTRSPSASSSRRSSRRVSVCRRPSGATARSTSRTRSTIPPSRSRRRWTGRCG